MDELEGKITAVVYGRQSTPRRKRTAVKLIREEQKANSDETQEVFLWLSGGEGGTEGEAVYNQCRNKKAWWLYQFVRVQKSAPAGLYKSFRTHKFMWREVSWTNLAERLKENATTQDTSGIAQ